MDYLSKYRIIFFIQIVANAMAKYQMITSYKLNFFDQKLANKEYYKLSNFLLIIFQKMQQLLLSINKNSLNNSKSKAMFTFPKMKRFPTEHSNNDSIYEKGSMLSKRSTNMGYGKKYDISKGKENIPSPDKYDKPSDFQKKKYKGQSFGLSREKVKVISIFNKNQNPGPSDYKLQTSTMNSHGFTIGMKFPSIQKKNNPGPLEYNIPQLTGKDNKVIPSQFKKNISYSIKKQQRETLQHQSKIGPGYYDFKSSGIGKQLLAKNITQKSVIFDRRNRSTMSLLTKTPGPGTYNRFSEFGS